MPWGEFVHITARYFKSGDFPWTNEDFYAQSVLPSEADVSLLVNPIILTLFEHEGPRYCPSWNWWEQTGNLWSVEELPLDQDYHLAADVVRYDIRILETGTSANDGDIGLLLYAITHEGLSEAFRPHLDEIKSAADFMRVRGKGVPVRVCFLTLWQCDAGKTYIPGEPDDYYEDWQLMGIVQPESDRVGFCSTD